MEARGEGGASLSGADPIHHSALHRFTRTSAAHFPSPPPPPPVAQAPALLGRPASRWSCLLWLVCPLLQVLSCAFPASVPIFYFFSLPGYIRH